MPAQRLHAARLVADALQSGAEGGADQHGHEHERAGEDHHRGEIERAGGGEVDPERAGAVEAGQAVVAAGDADPAVGKAPKDLAQRQRDHQEPKACGAQREDPEEQRHGRGEDHGRDGRRQVRQPRARDQPDGQVRRDAEVDGVPERDQSPVADQEVQAESEDGGDEDLGGDVDVEVRRRERRREQEQGKRGDQQGADHAARAPKSPFGRSTSAATMGRKRMT